MPIRTIFLDFDGTLVRSRPDLQPLVRAAALRAGRDLPCVRFQRASDEAWEELWPVAPTMVGRRPSFADLVHERALRTIGVTEGVDTLVSLIREEALSPQWHAPFPETEPVLAELRSRGFSLHLLSNNVDYLPLLLGNLGWSRRFDSVTYSQEIGVSKPDARLFHLGLRRAGCAPAEAVYVGDSWSHDYVGATRAGLAAVWVNRRGVDAPGPCRMVTDLTGLPPLLRDPPPR
jgi:HAD superfamily hydrolase (TIGR01509 family)